MIIDTIHRIKNRVQKLLLQIDELKGELKKAQEVHTHFQTDFAISIIEQKDQLEKEIGLSKDISKHQQAHLSDLSQTLDRLNVSILAEPLDTLAQFIHIVDTVKDEKKSNGRVTKVIKRGYLMNDELLRPTHVIVVDNSK